MIHLKAVELREVLNPPSNYPYTVPVMQRSFTCAFTTPITFLVGENGSGKSTFLEALACAVGSITVGSESVETDPTLTQVRTFARKNLKLAWQKKTRRGFFMRSEDFFGFAKKLSQLRQEMEDEQATVADEFKKAGRSSYATALATGPYRKELHALESAYGKDLDARSHGESYLKLFQSRFVPGGLYLLDEPEAPLSPSRQLALITMLKLMVDQDAQFIISTHSPILMAYPGAVIYSFDGGQIQPTAYDDLEHVTITRSFLSHPETFLQHLMNPEQDIQ